MTKIFGHYVASETAALWLIELLLLFVVFYALLANGIDLSPHNIFLQDVRPAGVLALAICLTAGAIGVYRREALQKARLLLVNLGIAALVALPMILVLSSALGVPTDAARRWRWAAELMVAWVLCLCVTRVLFGIAVRMRWLERQLLVVGGNAVPQPIKLEESGFFCVSRLMSREKFAAATPEQVRQQRIWGIVLLAGGQGTIDPQHLLRFKCLGIRLFRDTEFHERQLGRVDLAQLPHDWLAFADDFSCGWCTLAWRRLSDVLISLALLAFTLPLLLLVALLIKLDSAGPVFYSQERVGLHGRTFRLFKFRSMVKNAERAGATYAAKRDRRATRVGRLIRPTRIDELPQLLNVLRGEMSIVGPRPERPEFVEGYEHSVAHYTDRHFVKPGLTGWAQVNYPYGDSIEDARVKLSYDLYYLKYRSFFLDLLILLATVRVILFREGAR